MTASMTPVAYPFSTGRVGAGTDAAGEAGGLASVPAAPARFHQLPCQALHFHITAEEQRACEAEHYALMARWS